MRHHIFQYAAIIITAIASSPDTGYAGLIENIELYTGGEITLSIEGNAIRLTDNTSGSYPLRIRDTPGSGVTPMAQLGFVGSWETSSILSVPLQIAPLQATTRLDSLFDGVGLKTSGNILREITVFTHSGSAYAIDMDPAEVIGGTVPEPGTLLIIGLSIPAVLARRTPLNHWW